MAVVTLMYHDVVGGGSAASGFSGAGPNHYKVSVDRFEEHLDVIGACSLKPCLVGERAGERRLLLTFDDGGCSAAANTAPMLERRGWRGHFFVPTEMIGMAGFLARDELVALHKAGHHVGSHGRTHRALTGLDDEEVRREWSVSKAVLEDLLGATVALASVPRGRYSSRIGRLAVEAGYDHVFTSEPWLEPRRLESALVYGRFSVFAGTSAARIGALCSLSRPTVWWVGGTWHARKGARAVLGPFYDPLRRRLLARTR